MSKPSALGRRPRPRVPKTVRSRQEIIDAVNAERVATYDGFSDSVRFSVGGEYASIKRSPVRSFRRRSERAISKMRRQRIKRLIRESITDAHARELEG